MDTISISWNIPTIPNGIITVYEIRYRESNNNGLYNITNTTNTQYSIVELQLSANYTIEVRAYTSIGPGDWTIIPIVKCNKHLFYLTIYYMYSCWYSY